MDYIFYMIKNYNTLYLIYNIIFWSIYIVKKLERLKKIKDDWIII